MRELTDQEKRVLELLPDNKDHSISLKLLSGYTGYSKAHIKYIIMALRELYPICSDNCGYWLGDKTDMAVMIMNFMREIKTKEEVLNNLQNVYKEMGW